MARVTDKKRKGCFKSGCFLYVILPIITGAMIVGGIWYWENESRDVKEKTVEGDLVSLIEAIKTFKVRTGHYPATLNDLVAPDTGITTLPIDPFNSKNDTYRYLNIDDGKVVCIYSVGPDGQDNYTTLDITRSVVPPGRGEIGSIVQHLLIEKTKNDPDNALSLYLRVMTSEVPVTSNKGWQNAYVVMDTIYDLGWEKATVYYDLVQSVTADLEPRPDWWNDDLEGKLGKDRGTVDSPRLEDLFAYVDQFQSGLDLIREAYKRPYIKGDNSVRDTAGWSYMPNFLKLQFFAKYMAYDAYRLEEAGKMDKAMNNYLSMIRAGQAAQYGTGQMIDSLTTIACNGIELHFFIDSMMRGKYSSNELRTILNELERLDAGNPDFRSAMKEEHQIFSEFVDAMHRRPTTDLWKADSPLGKVYEYHQEARGYSFSRYQFKPISYNKCATEILLNSKDAVASNGRFWDFMTNTLDTPYSPTEIQNIAPMIDSMDDLNRMFLWGLHESKVKALIYRNLYRATQLMAGLQYYKALHGEYPGDLAALDDLYPSPLRDAFTDKPIVYSASGDTLGLYSPGPDLIDQHGRLEYDPTNGTFSSGDIIFAPRP